MTFSSLTIVTSCTNYGKYLMEWADSIIAQTVRPGRVCIVTHGTDNDQRLGTAAMMRLIHHGFSTLHLHNPERMNLGVARNRAVDLAETEWVLHLDADDMLFPDAVAELQRVAPTADVVQSGYERIGPLMGMSSRFRLYTGGDGEAMLAMPTLASGNSMFRRSLWVCTPYRTDLLGAWDTCLWIGFARLGARFRPTAKPIFKYRQHADSIFNKRRAMQGWERVHTSAMIKAARRNYQGVAIIVPRDLQPSYERQRNWERVRRHYLTHHPEWNIIEGFCSTVSWVKGAAVQDALNRCTAEILVIADADVMVDPSALECAVQRVQSGAPWAMPHHFVHRADAQETERLCASSELTLPRMLDRPVYAGFEGGGIVVVRHVDYDAIGGIPLGFRGWGHEDQALAAICTKLLGPCERGEANLVHLWHPMQPMAGRSSTNLQTLRQIGLAAQSSRDALVQTLRAMPHPAQGPEHAQRVTPINHAAIQARMVQRRAR